MRLEGMKGVRKKKDALNRVLDALSVALSMDTQFRKYRRALNKHRVEHTPRQTLDGGPRGRAENTGH